MFNSKFILIIILKFCVQWQKFAWLWNLQVKQGYNYIEHSDPIYFEWKMYRSTDKRYAGDNRLMTLERSYLRGRLAPRCRLITSWGCRRSQGFGCSPIKVVHELGLERRETVRSLSIIIKKFKLSTPSTRGPGKRNLWCNNCFELKASWWATFTTKI